MSVLRGTVRIVEGVDSAGVELGDPKIIEVSSTTVVIVSTISDDRAGIEIGTDSEGISCVSLALGTIIDE